MRLEHLLSGEDAVSFLPILKLWAGGDGGQTMGRAWSRQTARFFAVPFFLYAPVSVLGGLAQLARALAWHARGHRFDPDILHETLRG